MTPISKPCHPPPHIIYPNCTTLSPSTLAPTYPPDSLTSPKPSSLSIQLCINMLGFTKAILVAALAAQAAVAAPTVQVDRSRDVHLLREVQSDEGIEVGVCYGASKNFVKTIKAPGNNICSKYTRETGRNRTCRFTGPNANDSVVQSIEKFFSDECSHDGGFFSFVRAKNDDGSFITKDIYLQQTPDFNTWLLKCEGARAKRIYDSFVDRHDLCNAYQPGTNGTIAACIPSQQSLSEDYAGVKNGFAAACSKAKGALHGKLA
ncbi:hypothetical protein ACQY0O_000309 [Thecaphora frezii]